MNCTPGVAICTFGMILFAVASGDIMLRGSVALVQFGTINNGVCHFRGESGGEGPDLQEDNAAAVAQFKLEFDISQILPQGFSTATLSGARVTIILGVIVAALVQEGT
jgi:hypothetical protein